MRPPTERTSETHGDMPSASLGARDFSILQNDAQLIQIIDNALADAALRSGDHLACRPGCTQCCHGAFAINALDAQRLRAAMASLRAGQPQHAAALEARAQAYLSQYSSEFPGDRQTGILDTTPEAEAAFDDFANEAPCPALNPESGLCDLYEARPMTCRVFGPPVRMTGEVTAESQTPEEEETPAFAICELCFTTATDEEIAAAEMKVPHDEEAQLLRQLEETGSATGDTIVAYCLTRTTTAS